MYVHVYLACEDTALIAPLAAVPSGTDRLCVCGSANGMELCVQQLLDYLRSNHPIRERECDAVFTLLLLVSLLSPGPVDPR